MIKYNVEEKKVKEAIQQLYRDFAIKHNEISEAELSDSEKKAQIDELVNNTRSKEKILKNTKSLSELSNEEKEILEIKDQEHKVDMNVVDTLVSIYAQKAKMSLDDEMELSESITLNDENKLEEIDTTDFEKELRQYFTEHYYDLLEEGYNYFLSEITEVKDDDMLYGKNGELIEIATKYNIDPEKFNCFGYQLTVQDGLVAEEESIFGKRNIFYATPDGINNRIFDLYSEILYEETTNTNNSSINRNEKRKLKNTYITYAEENGIEIERPEVLETIPVDMEKVEGIAKYINRIINNKENIEKNDYTQLFRKDIIKNYSKIMNLQWYDFENLESVRGITGKDSYIDSLYLKIEEDNISRNDEFNPDIAYGTPEFIRKEYQEIMQQVKELHEFNAFQEKSFDIQKITAKKQAYRRYIQENNIEGIDISIPKVETDHDKTEMIAEAIMQQYGRNYEDKENIKNRILRKLEDNWAEIITEAQVIRLNKLFGEELKEMNSLYQMENLYVKDDFIYLGDYTGGNSKVIYATPEALEDNLKFLDEEIENSDINFDEKHKRRSLEKYAKEQGFDIEIPSIESVENKRKMERERFSFKEYGTEFMPDDPTARKKIELEDTSLDIIYKISEGIPGALVGIQKLMESDENGFFLLLGLDDMNIRGSQIWIAYKYLYNENEKEFIEAVRNRDEKMIEFINQETAAIGAEKAVTGGAAFDRSKNPNKYRFTDLEEVKQLQEKREDRIRKETEKRREEKKAEFIKMIEKGKKGMGVAIRATSRFVKERLVAKEKNSIKELDKILTYYKDKEQQAKDLYEEYEKQLPDKSHQEEL